MKPSFPSPAAETQKNALDKSKILYNHRKVRIVYDFKNSKNFGFLVVESRRKNTNTLPYKLHIIQKHKFDKLELEVVKVDLCRNSKKYFFDFVENLSRYPRLNYEKR